jgi:hypothetical protein
MVDDGTIAMSRSKLDEDSPGSLAKAVLTTAGLMSMAGAIAGLVWGGLAGRIAMRVLFLTSDDRVRGVMSDDGFEIGVFSDETAGLFIFATFAGAVLGFFGGLFRMFTAGPSWLISAGTGLAAAMFFGSMVVTSSGIDFLILEPLWLAIALFVLLPGAWGVSTVLLAEWLLRPGVVFRHPPQRVGERRFGGLGWVILGVVTIIGVADLSSDIQKLT